MILKVANLQALVERKRYLERQLRDFVEYQ